MVNLGNNYTIDTSSEYFVARHTREGKNGGKVTSLIGKYDDFEKSVKACMTHELMARLDMREYTLEEARHISCEVRAEYGSENDVAERKTSGRDMTFDEALLAMKLIDAGFGKYIKGI